MTTIAVIMPVFNEEKVIEQVVNSLLNQDQTGFKLAIYLIDGKSEDGTVRIIERIQQTHSEVHLLINEKRKTPFAFNLGLQATDATYVAMLGAHTVYDQNYLRVCLEELIKTNSAGCSGVIRPQTQFRDDEARLCYWVNTSVFGVSGSSFRTMQEGYADSIPYAVFKRDALLQVGGYNETLIRNQDNDMNQRLIDAGHKLYLTGKTAFIYQGKSTIGGLMQYAFTNGKWNAYSFRYFPKSMRIHHLIPFFFFLYVCILPIVGIAGWIELLPNWLVWLVFSGIFFYLILSMLESLRIVSREKQWIGLRCFYLFPRFHFSYGRGTFTGFLTPKDQFQS